MARAVFSYAPLSGAAPFLRTCRLGWGLVCHVSAVSRGRSPGNCFPQLGPGSLQLRGIWTLGVEHANQYRLLNPQPASGVLSRFSVRWPKKNFYQANGALWAWSRP